MNQRSILFCGVLSAAISGVALAGGMPNLPFQTSGLSSACNNLILQGAKQLATKDMNARLDKMPCYAAWDSMDDFDSPMATLITIISPDDADQVKKDYLKNAQNKLTDKGTPKLSAEESMNAFATDIAWQLKQISAGKSNKLVLVLGNVEAKGDANQQLVDDVFGKLAENDALTSDYAIISVPKDKAQQIITELSGSETQWSAPTGATGGGVQKAAYNPDDVYTIDGTLRQWTEPDGDVFHSELAARVYHPRTQTLVTGKEIRQDSDFYYHPTHGWISTKDDDNLARAYKGQPDLAPAFAAVAPIAGGILRNRLQTLNLKSAAQNTQTTVIAVNQTTRLLAKSEYEHRLDKMPATLAWKDIEEPGSHVNSLLSMLSPAGVADAKKKYARHAQSAFRVQSTSTLSTNDLVNRFSYTLSGQLKTDAAALGHKPVLVLGEVTTDDPQSQKLIYDAYEAIVKEPAVQQNCTIVGLSPDKARSLIADVSGDPSNWVVPDGSNLSDVSMKSFNPADMRIVQGEFAQGESPDGRWFRSVLSGTLLPGNKAKDTTAGLKISTYDVYYYHPTLNWISSAQEYSLQTSYVPARDDPALPQQLQPASLAISARPDAALASSSYPPSAGNNAANNQAGANPRYVPPPYSPPPPQPSEPKSRIKMPKLPFGL